MASKNTKRYYRWLEMRERFHKRNWKVGELASEYNISRRLVRKILKKPHLPNIARPNMLRELLPRLNALFGLEYDKYENEHSQMEAN